jgi:hypothetical protein
MRILLTHTPQTFISTLGPSAGSPVTIGQGVSLLWLGSKSRGHVYDAEEIFTIKIPTGVSGVRFRPGWSNDNRFGKSRAYGVGATSSNVVVDEHLRCNKQGIQPPYVLPSVSATGSGLINGPFTTYLRWFDAFGNRFSSLSAPGPLVTAVDQNFQWSNLPTDPLDDSVTHIQGLRDDGSGVARVAWTRELGVTSVLDTVETLALGEAAPPLFVPMPRGKRNMIYHDQQYVLGSDQFPERVFVSPPGRLEDFEGTFVATDGEPAVGLFQANDVAIFGSFEKLYRVQAFSALDFSRVIERPDAGLTGPDGVANAHGRAIVPLSTGIYLFDGTWHPILHEREEEWREELKKYQSEYFQAQGFFDQVENVYTFGPVPHSKLGDRVWWVLHCMDLFPEVGGGAYNAPWANDQRGRPMTTKGEWQVPQSPETIVVHGDTDGGLFEENVEDNLDDLEEFKRLIIEPGSVMPAPGGTPTDGNTFQKLWVYCYFDDEQPEASDVNLEMYSGGELQHEHLDSEPEPDPTMTDTLLPRQFNALAGTSEEPLTRQHVVLEGMAGDALRIRLIADRPPATLRWRGFGGTYSPGTQVFTSPPPPV